MSLLIKALEQAARDRKAARVEPPADAPTTGPGEPTLEPPPPPRPPEARMQNRVSAAEYASRAATETRAAPAAAGIPEAMASGAALDMPPPERRSPASLADLAQIDAQQQRARAAAVMQAGGGAAANAIALFRGNPVMLLVALAVLFGVGYGIYVYLQIARPGVFVRQAATKPQEVPAPASPVPPPAQAAPSAGPPASGPGGPMLTGPASEPPGVPGSLGPGASSSGSIAAAGVPTSSVPPGMSSVPAASPPAPIASKSIIGTAPALDVGNAPTIDAPRAPAIDTPRASAGDVGRAPVAERAPEPRRERARLRGDSAATSGPTTAGEPGPAARERITVSPTTLQPRLDPTLAQAYAALQSGNLDEARPLYTKLNQSEPLNIDALLGLAYIAAQENRSDEAVRLYLRILQLTPRHALAQAALIGLMGRADAAASESRLKQLIANEPSAFLHFVLGNLYADQSQWPQAQQSYFQAHHLEPDNPDYAYNVAVGLDHLRQSKLALGYYRRAEQLSSAQGRANFNLSHVRERIRVLSSQLE